MPEATAAAREIAHTDKSKLLMAFFLASEFVFFVFLILAYVDFNSTAISAGPTAAASLHPGTMAIYSACLFASSPTMWLGIRAFRNGSSQWFHRWMLVSIALGAVFLFGEGQEYYGLLGKNIDLGANLFGTTFFTLTGFHAFHLLIGLTLMAVLTGVSAKHGLRGAAVRAVEPVSMYWHFVDGMWVFIFSVVYLWSALS